MRQPDQQCRANSERAARRTACEQWPRNDIASSLNEWAAILGASHIANSLRIGGHAPQRPPVIEAFGHFQLLKRLGGGAYGDVFWAYDPQLDRDVAIKRPHQRRLPPELAERFAREARSAAQLKHRHIVGTYEVGENAWPLVPRIWLHHWLHQLVTFRVFRSQRLSF